MDTREDMGTQAYAQSAENRPHIIHQTMDFVTNTGKMQPGSNLPVADNTESAAPDYVECRERFLLLSEQ